MAYMRTEALAAFKRCCAAVSPFTCVEKALRLTDNELIINSSSRTVSLPISATTQFIITAFGKASIAMTLAAEQQLGQRMLDGIVIAPNDPANKSSRLRSRIFYGARDNLPDPDSVAATQEALQFIQKNDTSDTVFIFLVSGGGSALFCSPSGISLEAKLSTIRTLAGNGADIRVLNAFRQKLSAVKGGKTLNFVNKGRVVSLLISDLIDDLIQFIASGPTIPQTKSMIEMSQAIITSPKWTSLLTAEILEKVKEPSPPPYDGPEPQNIIIASNRHALTELEDYFSSLGYETYIISSRLDGNATEVGRYFAELITAGKNNLPSKLEKFGVKINSFVANKVALLFGGETTVVLRGQGRGGRCQEMALSCLTTLASFPDPLPPFLFLAAGTDGQDGPTDAAGALITDTDVREDSARRGLNYLNTSNSYEFWSTYNGGNNHLKPGRTGTNVMDVQIVLLQIR